MSHLSGAHDGQMALAADRSVNQRLSIDSLDEEQGSYLSEELMHEILSKALKS